MKTPIYTFIFMAIAITIGCRKLVEVDKPGNLIDTDQVFSHDTIAERAIADVYARIMGESGLLNGNLTRWGSLFSDDITRSTPNERDSGFMQATLTPAYLPMIGLWNKPYQYIYGCNSVLAGLRRTNGLSTTTANRIRGEALFLRALSYFYLTNLFGDVPLIVTTDYSTNASMPRTPQAIVYDTIIADLHTAISLLPVSYPGSEAMSPFRVRANKWSATTLLSRVWLYRQQWEQAITAASAVIGSGNYRLCDQPDSVFKNTSPETILQFLPIGYTTEAALFLTVTQGKPTYGPTTGLLAAFEQHDRRQTSWAPKKGNYHSIRKYQQTNGLPREYNVLFRLAELYLIRAEAMLRMNRTAEAMADINLLRQRAGLQALPLADRSTLLRGLANERRLEYFAELGHRFLDLKRWTDTPDDADPLKRMAIQVMQSKPHWTLQKNQWPLPASEISLNNQLVQNPGYQ